MKVIFVVDDMGTQLGVVRNALEGIYFVHTFRRVDEMVGALSCTIPDLILLDLYMPDINGFDAIRLLKGDERWKDIPVMLMTGSEHPDEEEVGLELGACDFIRKPFTKTILQLRIRNCLEVEKIVRERTSFVRTQTERAQRIQLGLVTGLAAAIESRDVGTGQHVRRTNTYTRLLLDGLIEVGGYIDELKGLCFEAKSTLGLDSMENEWDVDNGDMDLYLDWISMSASLHDIGKLAVPDMLLNKPSELTESEFEIIKQHPKEGENRIRSLMHYMGDAFFLNSALLFARDHHERIDGSGYPDGLKGENISLQGRVLAVADVFDALISERPYKQPYSYDKAYSTIVDGSGTHFDIVVIEAFKCVYDKMKLASVG